MDAKFHDGTWLGLRMKSDESIIGTPHGVIKKTVRRLPEDQRWCAEEVLSIRGVPPNPVLNVEKMSTRQRRSRKSVTTRQQLPNWTRQ